MSRLLAVIKAVIRIITSKHVNAVAIAREDPSIGGWFARTRKQWINTS